MEISATGDRRNTLEAGRWQKLKSILADALDFLHRQGLIHRDIKPSNVIFVNNRPKLADIGLVADIRPPERINTLVGTPGYMPPLPERPGTVQADIYAKLRQQQFNKLWQARKDESATQAMVSTDARRVELAVEMAMQKYTQIQLAVGR